MALEEDKVVAGAFGLEAEAGRDVPGEGVEPIEGAGEAGDEVGEAVEAADVGEFVEEDHAELRGGPLGGGGGEEEGGAKDAEGEGDGVAVGEEHDWGMANDKRRMTNEDGALDVLGEGVGEGLEGGWGGLGGAFEAAEVEQGEQQREEEGGRAEGPEEGEESIEFQVSSFKFLRGDWGGFGRRGC